MGTREGKQKCHSRANLGSPGGRSEALLKIGLQHSRASDTEVMWRQISFINKWTVERNSVFSTVYESKDSGEDSLFKMNLRGSEKSLNLAGHILKNLSQSWEGMMLTN